jgi:hypothetical protein
VIRACAWCSADDCGVITPDDRANQFHAPAPPANDQLTALIGRPIKYLPRMTSECRACLVAAGLAMKTCGRLDTPPGEIGLVGAGYEGCLIADQAYFRDYLTSGRSLGRGSLFIYTLPSSTLGEVAIALTLTGPGMHIQPERDPFETLAREAAQFVADGEADAMLALWSDATSAVCLAIDGVQSSDRAMEWLRLPIETDPSSVARRLAALVHPT